MKNAHNFQNLLGRTDAHDDSVAVEQSLADFFAAVFWNHAAGQLFLGHAFQDGHSLLGEEASIMLGIAGDVFASFLQVAGA